MCTQRPALCWFWDTPQRWRDGKGPGPFLEGDPAQDYIYVLLSSFTRVRLLVTPWAVTRLAPLSMGFPLQEYCRGLPFPSHSGSSAGTLTLTLLQGIFLIQGLNLGLPHCRQILYYLSRQGSPALLTHLSFSLLLSLFCLATAHNQYHPRE